jgi:glycerophosphoryl diester phosphodiesterase
MEHSFPLITAHAGCMNTPPNSIESVLQGIRAGADIIEVDVNATKDGVAVLFHDQHIRISSHQKLRIDGLMFNELQTVERTLSPESSSHFHQIIRLEEVLDVVQQFRKTLNVDLKNQACLKSMVDAVKLRNMVDDVIISGCHKKDAAYIKKQYPDFQVLLNADDAPVNDSGYKDYIKRTCRDAIAASCCGINMHYKDCRREMLLYARLRCLPVLIYTVDNVDEMKKFVTSGVHSITTNEVDTLLRLYDRTIQESGPC